MNEPTVQLPLWRRWNLIGPVGLWLGAALMAMLFLVVHLLGWREYTAILSGNMPATGGDLLTGLCYVLAYFLAVLAAPILAIAGFVYVALAKLLRGTKERKPQMNTDEHG